MKEEWKVIPGLKGVYSTSFGRVFANGRELKPIGNPEKRNTYQVVSLGGSLYKVHVLVAKAFLGDLSGPNMSVDHIDGNRYNNTCYNLEWVTKKENLRRAVELGKTKLCGVLVTDGSIFRVFPSIAECARFYQVKVATIRSHAKQTWVYPWRGELYVRRVK